MVFKRRRPKPIVEGEEGSSSSSALTEPIGESGILPLHRRKDNNNSNHDNSRSTNNPAEDIYPVKDGDGGSDNNHSDPTKVTIMADDVIKDNQNKDDCSNEVTKDGDGGGSDKTPSESSDDSDTATVEEADIDDDETNMMLEVILKIRADPEFAKSMYANCPRLQHLLNRNPDLRPIFEDPHLICLNFEKVYKDSGGILPEDEVKPTQYELFKKAVLVRLKIITSHPIFKVFKVLLFLKKLAGFISPMKLISCIQGWFCCSDDGMDDLLDDLSVDDMNEDQMQARIALNDAAEYMEDPGVQEEMNKMMENPETMQNCIENNDALRQLRDANPVCGELMSDPDTFRCLTDPDNLRALGEAPDCIAEDFAGGSYDPPDVDFGDADDFDLDVIDEGDDVEIDVEGGEEDLLEEDGGDDVDEPEAEDQDGDGDDEMDEDGDDEEEGDDGDDDDEEEEDGGPAAEDFEYENDQAGGAKGTGNKSRGKPQKKTKAQTKGGNGLAGAMMTAAVSMGAGYVLGDVAEMIPGGGEDDIDVDGLDELADDDVDLPDADEADLLDDVDEADLPDDAGIEDIDAADIAATAALGAWAISGDGMDTLAGEAEDIADTAEGAADEDEDKKKKKKVIVHPDGRRTIAYVDEDEEDDGEEEESGGRFGFMKDGLSAFVDTAKEAALATFIGDDLAEEALERLEEEDDDEEEDEDDLPSESDEDLLSDDDEINTSEQDVHKNENDDKTHQSGGGNKEDDDRSKRKEDDGPTPTGEDDFANALG